MKYRHSSNEVQILIESSRLNGSELKKHPHFSLLQLDVRVPLKRATPRTWTSENAMDLGNEMLYATTLLGVLYTLQMFAETTPEASSSFMYKCKEEGRFRYCSLY